MRPRAYCRLVIGIAGDDVCFSVVVLFFFLDLTRYPKNNCNLILICFAKNLQNINGKVESAPVICSLESNHEQYPGLSQHSSLAGLNDL